MKHTYIKNILTNELYPTTDFHFGGGVLTYIGTSVPSFTLTKGEWEYIEIEIEFDFYSLSDINTQKELLYDNKKRELIEPYQDILSSKLVEILNIKNFIGVKFISVILLHETYNRLSKELSDCEDTLNSEYEQGLEDTEAEANLPILEQKVQFLENLTSEEINILSDLIPKLNKISVELNVFKKIYKYVKHHIESN
jgi:hypothetical protein